MKHRPTFARESETFLLKRSERLNEMAPNDLPCENDSDISDADVSLDELQAIVNDNAELDSESETESEPALEDQEAHQADPEEDWSSEYPPYTPYVPTPEVIAEMDELIRTLQDQANLATFGTTDPQDSHYDEFFKHFPSRRRPTYYHNYDDDEDEDDCFIYAD